MTTLFEDDDSFRNEAIRLGYMSVEEIEECVRIQHRTVGRTIKRLEVIALERKFVTLRDVTRMKGGETLDSETPAIPGYEVKDVLGKGGLGTVYRARQTNMKRDVALKVLHPRWVSDDEFRKRFLLEARIVGKMSHRNLIQVFDIGHYKGFYYFSMELVEGRTVHQELRGGAFEVERAMAIAIQIADAVKYLRDLDLVHRDIKPSNILLTRNDVAKLGDFGFVKSRLDSQLANEDYILGTPDYISPEQALGDENLDFRSDIYSLGASLYHMVTGHLPYDGTESMVIKKHIKADIPSPQSRRPDLSDEVCQVIERMMAKHPEDRYLDLDDLINDLRLVRVGRAPGTDRLEPGKSTIFRALDRKNRRARELTEERATLRRQIDRLENQVRMLVMSIAILTFLLVTLGLAFVFIYLMD